MTTLTTTLSPLTVVTTTFPTFTSFTISNNVTLADFITSAVALEEIVSAYKDWNDELAKDLKSWAKRILSIKPDGGPESSIKKEVEDQISHLSEKILVGVITKKPLENPILVNNWTWERDALDLYLNNGGTICPIEGTPIIETKTHAFAVKILEWTAKIMPQRTRPHIAMKVNAIQLEPAMIPLFACFVTQIGGKAYECKQYKEQVETLKKATESLEKLEKEIGEAIESVAARGEENAATHARVMKEKLEDIEEAHAATTAMQEEKINEEIRKVNALNKDLHAAQESITKLKKDGDTLKSQLQQAVDALNQMRGRNSGGRCVIL